jgi:hypothetical protein
VFDSLNPILNPQNSFLRELSPQFYFPSKKPKILQRSHLGEAFVKVFFPLSLLLLVYFKTPRARILCYLEGFSSSFLPLSSKLVDVGGCCDFCSAFRMAQGALFFIFFLFGIAISGREI